MAILWCTSPAGDVDNFSLLSSLDGNDLTISRINECFYLKLKLVGVFVAKNTSP